MESKPVVTVLGKSYIPPATPTKRGHFFLSCLDIFWQDIHYNQRLILYKTSPQESSSTIEALKTSLSLVLVHYYPWAGRLALGEDRRLVIDCNDLGVEFVEASIDLPISELEKDEFQMKSFFQNLCQHLDQKGQHLYTSPLLSLQATRFSDGGLAVGVALSHVVADGLSLWNFLVSWGECARGEGLSLEPVHDRKLLAVHDPSPEKAFLNFGADIEEGGDGRFSWEQVMNFRETDSVTDKSTENGTATEKGTVTDKPTEHDGMTGSEAGGADTWIEKSGMAGGDRVQGVFYMSEASIKKLKSEAAETTGKNYSSFVVLCAHFWQRASIARQRPSTEVAGMGILVNNRSRLTPPLPPAYFGNAVTFAMVAADAGTITQESLGAVAARTHAAIAGAKEERVRGLMNWLELHDNRFLSHIQMGSMPLVNVASSPWFPAYEVDFGWGKPAAVRPVKVPSDGELVLFGGRPGAARGDVEVCMSLSSDAMRNLLSDPQFLASYPITPPTVV